MRALPRGQGTSGDRKGADATLAATALVTAALTVPIRGLSRIAPAHLLATE
ncbi:hypothetical protein ACWDE0_15025 [Streptomyces sp. 900105755]|uniref:hypothetical protein n=1 Tax=Streptomyces sp. 900105755 TaxID=3154389 RepID=UPI0033295395